MERKKEWLFPGRLCRWGYLPSDFCSHIKTDHSLLRHGCLERTVPMTGEFRLYWYRKIRNSQRKESHSISRIPFGSCSTPALNFTCMVSTAQRVQEWDFQQRNLKVIMRYNLSLIYSPNEFGDAHGAGESRCRQAQFHPSWNSQSDSEDKQMPNNS